MRAPGEMHGTCLESWGSFRGTRGEPSSGWWWSLWPGREWDLEEQVSRTSTFEHRGRRCSRCLGSGQALRVRLRGPLLPSRSHFVLGQLGAPEGLGHIGPVLLGWQSLLGQRRAGSVLGR